MPRTSRRIPFALVIGVLAAAIALVMSGCGVRTSATEAVPERWVDPPSISARAKEMFTVEQIRQAYAEITEFALAHGYDPAFMDPQRREYTAEQLSAGVTPRMSAGLRPRWDERVASALAGDQGDQDGLRVLQFYDWEQPTWQLPADGRAVRSQWIRNAEIGGAEPIETTPARLKITLIHQATVRYSEDGTEFELDVAKRVSYWLLPNAAGSPAWLLDAYEGVFAVGEDLPVEEENQQPIPEPTTTPGVPGPEGPAQDPQDSVAGELVAPSSADGPPETSAGAGIRSGGVRQVRRHRC